MNEFKLLKYHGPWFVILTLMLITSLSALSVSGQDGDKTNDALLTAQKAANQKQEKNSSIDDDPNRPFQRRIDVPDFPKGIDWLNSKKPLSKRDLKGKFVLLDFWTYCCINCIHILPELKKLEKKYPNRLVVIGVHSAKFETEKETRNIREAILRYEIEHPVVNDSDHEIWQMYGVQSWPSIRLLDPEGKMVAGHSGEIRFEDLDAFLKPVFRYYEKKGLVDPTPLKFELENAAATATPLRFPGKILADEKGQRLFITDSNHNRIVVTDLEGKLLQTIGSGRIGKKNGDFNTAEFDHPQGTVLHKNVLYVADTENHCIRKVDLAKQTVTTIAGTGKQASRAFQHFNARAKGFDIWAGNPKTTALNSPWALWVHERDLYIAMAGPHQIWKMPLNESKIGPFAGNGREDIVDGPLLPREPYAVGASSFAQPSGLTSDGQWLYVADTEGSSIRAVPFDESQKVRTVVGTSNARQGRLFIFGDKDGKKANVLLQHAIGITYHNGQLFIADTYNNKIKMINAATGFTRTLAGNRRPGNDDRTGTFDEPAGIAYANGSLYVADTNNHLIRKVDPDSGKVSTLVISGLEPPKIEKEKPVAKIRFPKAPVVKVKTALKPVDGQVELAVQLNWPNGWKTNELAKMGYFLFLENDQGSLDRKKISLEKISLPLPANQFAIKLPVAAVGSDRVRVEVPYYYCQTGDSGVCKYGQVAFDIDLTVDNEASKTVATLTYSVPE